MSPRRVLLVEDSPVDATHARGLLRVLGHECCGSAVSGERALEMAGELRPDVVLMDAELEGEMDGVEAARRIKLEMDLPVILVTGLDAGRALARGGGVLDCFLEKPLSKDTLAANLQFIVENHALRRRLAERNEDYRRLLENALAGIFRADPDGALVWVNDALCGILGYDGPQDMLACCPRLGARYYVRQERWNELLDLLESDGEAHGFQSRVYGRDGDVLWVSEHVRGVRDAAGRLAAVEGVVVDVTDRHEAEVGLQAAVHQLDQVVDSLADPLLVTDLEHNMILCNAVFRRVFGLDEDAEPDCARLLQGMSGGRWSESFARFARRPGIYRIPAGPGNGGRAASSHLLTLSPYVSPEGELVGVIYTFTPLARTGGA